MDAKSSLAWEPVRGLDLALTIWWMFASWFFTAGMIILGGPGETEPSFLVFIVAILGDLVAWLFRLRPSPSCTYMITFCLVGTTLPGNFSIWRPTPVLALVVYLGLYWRELIIEVYWVTPRLLLVDLLLLPLRYLFYSSCSCSNLGLNDMPLSNRTSLSS